ncbi:hypothetical protein A3F06_03145 [candidate division TM6 bacterium RIFCSPHIGHO2_12_FULL_36_22]|nr:MAG: hypothetical protein A3F06_03145 [candidate division TM6 bacterium RIFCSPHIGHO2_12_FULL_36_22]
MNIFKHALLLIAVGSVVSLNAMDRKRKHGGDDCSLEEQSHKKIFLSEQERQESSETIYKQMTELCALRTLATSTIEIERIQSKFLALEARYTQFSTEEQVHTIIVTIPKIVKKEE